MVPEEKRAAVFQGLREAFGTTVIDDTRAITKGLSTDLVFRIVVRGSPFLLKIVTRMNEFADPARTFKCMKAAAGAGIAPRVWYANAEDGVSIIDFVDEKPFPATQALIQLPRILSKLHALPAFPKTFNYVTAHNGFIWRFRGAGLAPRAEIDEVFSRYEQVCAVYPRLDRDLVPCHMDLKPENILFDGQRVWLVDWMAAFMNDRYFDLAVAANFLAASDEDESTYLKQYFGQQPDRYQLARFFLMRQVVHMFYATVFLMLGSAGKPIDRSDTLPSFRDFHQRIWAGEFNLADDELKIVYGNVHWEQLVRNTRQTDFDEALDIVSGPNMAMEDVQLLLPSAP
ncbi:MAG: phosphotransferase [Bryobacteraceae bacterium]